MNKILVINPGSTSTKVAIFQGDEVIASETLEHTAAELNEYKKLVDQTPFRKKAIIEFVKKNGLEISDFKAIAARGGILPPLKSGTYKVSEEMINYFRFDAKVEHASNLASVIAWELSDMKIPVFITDPVSVDEFIPESRISGMADLPRKSQVHALNIRITARRAAKEIGKKLENANFVVAHLGGGISVAAIENGKIIDVNNANDEGPFSVERSGELPVGDIVKVCYSGKYEKADLRKRYVGKGGLMAYLGTNDLREALKLAKTDNNAKIVVDAMAYQIAKEIGGMATVLKGKVDAIIITGGMAHSDEFVKMIKNRIAKLGLIMIYPGSYEMEALALGAERVLNGSEEAMTWEGK